MTETLAERIRQVIGDQLGEFDDHFDRSRVTNDASLVEDLGADSLDVLDLKIKFEDAFGIELDYIDGLQTVGDIINYLEGRVHGR